MQVIHKYKKHYRFKQCLKRKTELSFSFKVVEATECNFDSESRETTSENFKNIVPSKHSTAARYSKNFLH